METYDPIHHSFLDSIGALKFFGPELVEQIRKSMRSNTMTPAVVQQRAAELLAERDNYLKVLNSLLSSLQSIGVRDFKLEKGQAEIGFQLPRALFSNELGGLISELRALRRIIRAFTELETGSTEPIEVHQISTSDPIFFFGVNVLVIAQLGLAVTWALNTWKQVEEVRKIRSDAKKTNNFTEDEIKNFFDSKIKNVITSSIDEKVDELVSKLDSKGGRREEQRNDLKWALESVFGRIERGMTVEVRYVSPPEAPLSDDGESSTHPQSAVYETLSQVKSQLIFPEPESSPVLSLPSTDIEHPEHPPRKSKPNP